MPFNGNGTFVLPGPPLEPGEIVSADEHNELRDDMATGFTDCVTRDGQSPAVANLPMGTYKHTNVGASNALTNYARTDQVQNSSFNWLTSVSGSNTITAASAVAPAAYAAGQRFAFIPSAVNTDPVTININSLGAKSIKLNGHDDLYAGFLNPGTVYTIVYDGTAFQIALANNSGVFYVERFSGDGSETEFTLTRSAINKNYLLVYIYGVYQQKDTYSFSGTTLTFDTAPPLGTDNIEVVISSTLAIGETDASAVSYTLPATGAVTTNVEAKLAQTVSVKDFGAVGDGVTDDTAAIQAAIDATQIDGVLSLVNQNYKVSGVTIDKRMTLKDGQLTLSSTGTTSVITIANATNGTLLQNIKTVIGTVAATNASGIFINNCTNIRLENCEAVGAKAAVDTDAGIYAQDGSNITMIDCVARNCQKEGIITRGTDNVTFIRCSGYDNGSSAVGTSTGVGLYAVDCYGENSGASGLTFNSQEMLIVNPKSKNNASQNGITVGHTIVGQYAEKVRIVNPICVGAPSIGLYVAYSTDLVISGGEFYNCGTTAIQIDPNPALTGTIQILGGIVIDGCQQGIDITMPSAPAAHDVMISEAAISNFSNKGIYVMLNGDIIIESCKIKADPAVLSGSVGIRAHGSYVGSARSGTAKTITIRDNLIEDVATSAVYAFNCSRLSVIGNTFRDCNTSDSVGMPLIQTSGVIPGTATQLPMPNPYFIANNIAVNSSLVAIFANAAVSTFDTVQKRLNFYNNAFDGTAANTLDYDTTKYTLSSDVSAHGSIYLLNTDQTLANNTVTQLQLNAAINVGGVTTDTTTTYSITAIYDGVYLIGGRASFAANVTGLRELFVYKNGVLYTSVGAGASTGENLVEFTLMLRLAKGEYVQLYARQTSGGNLDVLAASDDNRTNFWIARIGNR